MTADALLYVFYGSPVTCANRLRIYRAVNPSLALYGICTAGISQRSRFRAVEDQLDDLWFLPEHDSKWCWNNLDKVACHWFLERGNNLQFSKIMVVDWDVLLLEPVSKWLDQVAQEDVKIIDVWENLNPQNNYWTSSNYPGYDEFKQKLSLQHPDEWVLYNAFLFAYACNKSAFEKFSNLVIDLPGYCEFRFPTVMASQGLKISNFERPINWGEFTQVSGLSIPRKVIRNELENQGGFRMFHPIYEPYCNPSLDLSLIDVFRDGSWLRTFSRAIENIVRRAGIRPQM